MKNRERKEREQKEREQRREQKEREQRREQKEQERGLEQKEREQKEQEQVRELKEEGRKQKTREMRKQDIRYRRNHPIRWDRLDNTANLFPVIAGESMTNVYRISVILKEKIQKNLLQEALDMVLPKFDGFNVRLRRGIFWYYFEENGKVAPLVIEENTFPCRYIQQNRNQNYLFRVTFYDCRINLEVFHVLTDGMGGLNFLRELTYQYLRLAHCELRKEVGDSLSCQTSLNREDSFLRNYKRKSPRGYQKKRAYAIRLERLPAGELGIMHAQMPIHQLKEVAHRYDVTINEYLVALFAYSTYQECLHGMPSQRPIRIAVPVNLRPYFDSVTTKNFFIMISAEFSPVKENYSFEEVIAIIRKSLRAQMNKEHLEELFSYTVAGQLNGFARPVPLTLKNAFMKMIYTQSTLANTTTVTNIGNIQVEEIYRPYIEMFHALIAMSKGQSIKGTICSFQDTLIFTFTSLFSDTCIQKAFLRKAASDGVEIVLKTNGVY